MLRKLFAQTDCFVTSAAETYEHEGKKRFIKETHPS